MRVIVSHRTALGACSRIAASGRKLARPCKLRSLRECASAGRDVSTFDLSPLGLHPDERLVILVPDARSRFASKRISRHVWTGGLPDGSLYQVGEGVYVTSPEFSLLLVSKATPFNKLIALCDEVCGLYSLDASERGFFDRPALSSVAKIDSYLSRVGAAGGTAKLRRALRYAVDNSRSPMESALATFAALPTRCGGFGFPKPVMNRSMSLTGEAARMAGRSYVQFDLLFPERKVVVEYDSRSFHAAADRLESDARRNNTLRYLGFTVVNVTWGQVRDPAALDGVMAQVAKALGRPRPASGVGLARRAELRRDLLP